MFSSLHLSTKNNHITRKFPMRLHFFNSAVTMLPHNKELVPLCLHAAHMSMRHHVNFILLMTALSMIQVFFFFFHRSHTGKEDCQLSPSTNNKFQKFQAEILYIAQVFSAATQWSPYCHKMPLNTELNVSELRATVYAKLATKY